MPSQIKQSDIEMIGEDTTVIKGSAGKTLANSLIQKHGITLSELAHGAHPVNPEDISIDDSGRVVIKSKTFAAALKQRMGQTKVGDHGFFDTNCSCRK